MLAGRMEKVEILRKQIGNNGNCTEMFASKQPGWPADTDHAVLLDRHQRRKPLNSSSVLLGDLTTLVCTQTKPIKTHPCILAWNMNLHIRHARCICSHLHNYLFYIFQGSILFAASVDQSNTRTWPRNLSQLP